MGGWTQVSFSRTEHNVQQGAMPFVIHAFAYLYSITVYFFFIVAYD